MVDYIFGRYVLPSKNSKHSGRIHKKWSHNILTWEYYLDIVCSFNLNKRVPPIVVAFCHTLEKVIDI